MFKNTLKNSFIVLLSFVCLGGWPGYAQKKEEVFKRIVAARIYYKNIWTVGEETSESIGKALASLHPTYVAGLIHLDDRTELSEAHTKAYNTIREVVLKESPACKFDFVLNPGHYKKPEDVLKKMQSIEEKIKVDIWYLDFYEASYKASAKVLEAIITHAHQNGQLVGGNAREKILLKEGDFVAVHDGQKVNSKMREEIKKAKEDYGISVVFQINNDSDRSTDDTIHTFIRKWKKHEREAHIQRLARNQQSWKYHLMYPVFFPVYLHQHAYNGTKDDNMLEVYQKLMGLYNQ